MAGQPIPHTFTVAVLTIMLGRDIDAAIDVTPARGITEPQRHARGTDARRDRPVI